MQSKRARWEVQMVHIVPKTKPMDALNKCAVHKKYIYSYSLASFHSRHFMNDSIDSERE